MWVCVLLHAYTHRHACRAYAYFQKSHFLLGLLKSSESATMQIIGASLTSCFPFQRKWNYQINLCQKALVFKLTAQHNPVFLWVRYNGVSNQKPYYSNEPGKESSFWTLSMHSDKHKHLVNLRKCISGSWLLLVYFHYQCLWIFSGAKSFIGKKNNTVLCLK